MESPNGNGPEIESERAFVVYDEATGAVVHVHETVTARDADGKRSEEEDQERAIELARAIGHDRSSLKALAVKPGEFDFSTPQLVDLDTMSLTRDPSAGKS